MGRYFFVGISVILRKFANRKFTKCRKRNFGQTKFWGKTYFYKNIQNYNNAGKIYVPVYEKILQTFLSIIDFIKLLFVKELNYDNDANHNILNKEINLDERI